MVRTFLKALILVPVAVLLVLFAVANRQWTGVSLDPFSSEPPALAIHLPLFRAAARLALAALQVFPQRGLQALFAFLGGFRLSLGGHNPLGSAGRVTLQCGCLAAP